MYQSGWPVHLPLHLPEGASWVASHLFLTMHGSEKIYLQSNDITVCDHEHMYDFILGTMHYYLAFKQQVRGLVLLFSQCLLLLFLQEAQF